MNKIIKKIFKNMTKMEKLVSSLLTIWIVAVIVSVWLIGGQSAAYMWVFSVFIVAPAAIILLLVQMIVLIIRIFKKRRLLWNCIFIAYSIVLALPITVMFGISPVTYPRNAKNSECVEVLTPVENAILVGGKNYKEHAMWPSECYAYDIVCEPHNVGSKELNDYGIYGKDIMSPVSGTIIGIDNDEYDIEPGSDSFTSLLGNYIFIKIDKTNTYMILAHLQKGSITVKENSHVDEGTIIGKVGNSGTTSEPHLHIQHQRNNPLHTKFLICSVGLPLKFH